MGVVFTSELGLSSLGLVHMLNQMMGPLSLMCQLFAVLVSGFFSWYHLYFYFLQLSAPFLSGHAFSSNSFSARTTWILDLTELGSRVQGLFCSMQGSEFHPQEFRVSLKGEGITHSSTASCPQHCEKKKKKKNTSILPSISPEMD